MSLHCVSFNYTALFNIVISEAKSGSVISGPGDDDDDDDDGTNGAPYHTASVNAVIFLSLLLQKFCVR